MTPEERYSTEAPPPTACTTCETLRYTFDEIQRRSFQSTRGLTEEDINVDPGHGAWTIGEILVHQLHLVHFMMSTMKPGCLDDFEPPDFGEKGKHRLETILACREILAERFRDVLPTVTEDEFLMKRPQLPPKGWADWPVLMRVLRPLTDLATHTGQINYARRQLGKPVGR